MSQAQRHIFLLLFSNMKGEREDLRLRGKSDLPNKSDFLVFYTLLTRFRICVGTRRIHYRSRPRFLDHRLREQLIISSLSQSI